MFLDFEEKPVASGAIAQVHRGKVVIRSSSSLSSSSSSPWVESEEKSKEAGVSRRWVRRGEGGEEDEALLLDVAVKVAHPNVLRDAQQDLTLLMLFSRIVDFSGSSSFFFISIPSYVFFFLLSPLLYPPLYLLGLFPSVSLVKSMSAFSERMLRLSFLLPSSFIFFVPPSSLVSYFISSLCFLSLFPLLFQPTTANTAK